MVEVDPRAAPPGVLLLLLGALALLVGGALPWFEAAGDPVTGFEHGDGYVTAGVAVAIVALAVALEWSPIARVGAVLGALLTGWIVFDVYVQVADLLTHDTAIGLWVTLAGALAVLAATIWATVAERRAGEPIVLLRDPGLDDGDAGVGEEDAEGP